MARGTFERLRLTGRGSNITRTWDFRAVLVTVNVLVACVTDVLWLCVDNWRLELLQAMRLALSARRVRFPAHENEPRSMFALRDFVRCWRVIFDCRMQSAERSICCHGQWWNFFSGASFHDPIWRFGEEVERLCHSGDDCVDCHGEFLPQELFERGVPIPPGWTIFRKRVACGTAYVLISRRRIWL